MCPSARARATRAISTSTKRRPCAYRRRKNVPGSLPSSKMTTRRRRGERTGGPLRREEPSSFFSHPEQERTPPPLPSRHTHATGDSLALAFLGRDHKPAHLAMGLYRSLDRRCLFVEAVLPLCAASPHLSLSTSLLLFCPLHTQAVRAMALSTASAGLKFSLFISLSLFYPTLLFFARHLALSRDPVKVLDDGEERAVTLGSCIFAAEQSLSRFPPLMHARGKRTVYWGVSRAPCPQNFLISPAKRLTNATQARPTTLVAVSALRKTRCFKSGRKTFLWSPFFFPPDIFRCILPVF